jgi:hypothetical protein
MVLLAKLLLAPACVVAVSLAARRWGPAVGGILGGLPVVAGPILFVLTVVHGDDFGSSAAAGTLLGLCALATFVVVYARVAAALRPVGSLLCGWACFLAAVGLLDQIHPPDLVALGMAGACFALGLRLVPEPAGPLPRAEKPPAWDLPARALASMALVVALTAVSGRLGPGLSGLLAPFPIITGVLAVFTHAHSGVGPVRVLLRNFLIGFYGFATFCFTLAIGLRSLGTAAGFLIATAVAVLTQLTVFAGRRLINAKKPPVRHREGAPGALEPRGGASGSRGSAR